MIGVVREELTGGPKTARMLWGIDPNLPVWAMGRNWRRLAFGGLGRHILQATPLKLGMVPSFVVSYAAGCRLHHIV